MRTRLSFFQPNRLILLLSMCGSVALLSGCIVDYQEDDDYGCCDYSSCSSCGSNTYYYVDEEDEHNDESIYVDSDTVIKVDTSFADTDSSTTDTSSDSSDTGWVEDTETEELTYFEQYQCGEEQVAACGQTICGAIEDYNDALAVCEEQTCGCGYLEACLLVHLQCLGEACADESAPDSAAMVECAMDYALCINLCH